MVCFVLGCVDDQWMIVPYEIWQSIKQFAWIWDGRFLQLLEAHSGWRLPEVQSIGSLVRMRPGLETSYVLEHTIVAG